MPKLGLIEPSGLSHEARMESDGPSQFISFKFGGILGRSVDLMKEGPEAVCGLAHSHQGFVLVGAGQGKFRLLARFLAIDFRTLLRIRYCLKLPVESCPVASRPIPDEAAAKCNKEGDNDESDAQNPKRDRFPRFLRSV